MVDVNGDLLQGLLPGAVSPRYTGNLALQGLAFPPGYRRRWRLPASGFAEARGVA